MKPVGIICDNFKLDKFQEELDKLGISYTIRPMRGKTSVIDCKSEQSIIKPVVDKVTQYFIDLNKKK